MDLKLKIIEIEISPEHYDPEKGVFKGASLEKLRNGKLDLESFIHDHFVNLGYKVIRGSHYDPTFELQGAPDFYVEKDGHGFFVEVKSWDDSLSLKQIAWMLVHSDYEFKLAVVPQGFFDVHPWREGQSSGGKSVTDREISIERENNPRS